VAPVADPHHTGVRRRVIAVAAVALAALIVAASSPAGAVLKPPRPISELRAAEMLGLGHAATGTRRSRPPADASGAFI
jgi:hypothetical protein